MTLDDKIATVLFEMKTSDCECEYYTYEYVYRGFGRARK